MVRGAALRKYTVDLGSPCSLVVFLLVFLIACIWSDPPRRGNQALWDLIRGTRAFSLADLSYTRVHIDLISCLYSSGKALFDSGNHSLKYIFVTLFLQKGGRHTLEVVWR